MIPYRGEGDEVRHLKQSGDVGKVNPIPFHPLDENSIRDCIGNSDIVINLVGKYYQTKNLYLRKNYTYSFVFSSFSQIPRRQHLLPRAPRPNLQRAGQDASPPRVGSAAEPPASFGVGSHQGSLGFSLPRIGQGRGSAPRSHAQRLHRASCGHVRRR